jgi:ATP:ADP antiporter, AAA family
MLGAAAVTAQFVGGKAARDALFLGSLGFTALPTMVIATAGVSIMLLAVSSSNAHKLSPKTLVPGAFAASGVLLLLEWLLTYKAHSLGAIVVYLHISALGPLLGSWFWLIVTERFDPRTAKRYLGRIAGAGTLGGLLSALLAERIGAAFGVAAMLPFLAAFHFFSAWQVRRLAVQSEAAGRATALEPDSVPTLSGWRVLAKAPYLRRLATLVLLGATSAALLDYLFKAEAVKVFGRGDTLLRFFAIYYAATSLIAFVIQTSSSRAVLERFGLGLTTSTPSFALLGGGIGGLIAPGLGSLIAARGGESVLRSSLFRSGYELFYTPMPAEEKRAAKAIVDVGMDRLGEALGGGLVRGVLLLAPASQYWVILPMGMACSAAAIVAASRLTRGYIHTLEKRIIDGVVEIDLSDTVDGTTRTLLMKTLGRDFGMRTANRTEAARRAGTMTATALDPELQKLHTLRSRDRARVAEVLRREEGLTPALVPDAIQLLAWDPVAADAMFALRKVAAERVGQLIDALIDPNQDFAVRRRLPRVFSVCISQRAADGLLLGLNDLRFEVRYRCGRSLAAMFQRNPTLVFDSERIFAVVLRETNVGRPIWESRRLLDEVEAPQGEPFVDEFVRNRAGRSLTHVFTLLTLALPAQPLQIAFRSLQTEDMQLRGTALEYLDGVLPAPIRDRLWPYLEVLGPVSRRARPRDEILADLMRSNHSVMVNLEDLRRRADTSRAGEGTAKPPLHSVTTVDPV